MPVWVSKINSTFRPCQGEKPGFGPHWQNKTRPDQGNNSAANLALGGAGERFPGVEISRTVNLADEHNADNHAGDDKKHPD